MHVLAVKYVLLHIFVLIANELYLTHLAHLGKVNYTNLLRSFKNFNHMLLYTWWILNFKCFLYANTENYLAF